MVTLNDTEKVIDLLTNPKYTNIDIDLKKRWFNIINYCIYYGLYKNG